MIARHWRPLAGLGVLVLALTGCVEDTDTGGDGSTSADRSAELTVALPYSFNSFDPHRSPTPEGDQVFIRPACDTLLAIRTGRGGSAELSPRLATSYTTAADGRSVTFVLRAGVTFSDGARFDASAVKANLERAKGPGSTVSSHLSSVTSVDVVDPTHVVLRLAEPDPSVPWELANGSTGYMISPQSFGNKDVATRPVCSGPYKVVSASKDSDIVYERWDGSWEADQALARKLTISLVQDPNVGLNGTKSGEFDIAYMPSPFDSRSKSLQSQGYHWTQRLSPLAFGAALNTTKAPFDDVRVRRAVSMMLDRRTISAKLLNGVSPPAYQTFVKGYLGYDPALDRDPYDKAAAKALVRQAGAVGAKVRIIQPQVEPAKSLAEILQQALIDVGIKAELAPYSSAEIRVAWHGGSYEAMVTQLLAQPEPGLTLKNGYLGGDNLGTPPAALVSMARRAKALPAGSAQQTAAYRAIAKYLVDNPIHVPIAAYSAVFLSRPGVIGADTLIAAGIADLDFRGVGVGGH